jgi:hypothetical protein
MLPLAASYPLLNIIWTMPGHGRTRQAAASRRTQGEFDQLKAKALA